MDKSKISGAALLTGMLAMLSTGASATLYDLSVTRKDSNLYRVDGKDILIQTRYCYVYAYSEEAILKTSGYGGDLIFPDSKDKCEIKAVFGHASQAAGKYRIQLNREEDNWYEVWGQGIYLRTSLCLSLALGDDAVLTMYGPSSGRVVFDDGDSCDVEGVYSKLRF